MAEIITLENEKAKRWTPPPHWEFVPLESAARSLLMDFGDADDPDLIAAIGELGSALACLIRLWG